MAYDKSSVRVRICKAENIEAGMRNCINVGTTIAVDALHVHSSKVSGVHLWVQANLVMEAATAQAIEDAVIQIEMQRTTDTKEIVFSCPGGTHRSLGCGCLLLAWEKHPWVS